MWTVIVNYYYGGMMVKLCKLMVDQWLFMIFEWPSYWSDQGMLNAPILSPRLARWVSAGRLAMACTANSLVELYRSKGCCKSMTRSLKWEDSQQYCTIHGLSFVSMIGLLCTRMASFREGPWQCHSWLWHLHLRNIPASHDQPWFTYKCSGHC